MKGYPRWFPAFIIVTVVALIASGCLLAPTTLFFRYEYDVPWRLSGDNRIIIVFVHVLVSYIILMAMGAIWHLHMRIGLRNRVNICSGLQLVACFVVLTLTGVSILYFSNEQLLNAASLIHLGCGGIIPIVLSYHIIKGRIYNKLHSHKYKYLN